MFSIFVHSFGLNICITVPILVAAFIVSERLKNAGLVDFIWALCIAILALIATVTGTAPDARKWLFLAATLPWSLRLFWHLLTRFMHEFPTEDRRYAKMRLAWPKHPGIFMLLIFLFQAFLLSLLCAPFAIINDVAGPLELCDLAGLTICSLGFLGETISDQQLRTLKEKHSANAVCDVGLWKYSRHPNYFFEWLVWLGLFVFCIPHPGWAMSAVSPLLMLYLLTQMSGIKITEEQSMQSKGEAYRQYQQNTSAFFPLPPRASRQ